METLDDLNLILRSLLLSNPKITKANGLQSDFFKSEERHFPYRQFGFSTFVDYLRSIPSVVKLVPINSENPDVFPVGREESRHIEQLVSKQKIPSQKSSSKSYNRSGSCNGRQFSKPRRSSPLRRRPLCISPGELPKPLPKKVPLTFDQTDFIKKVLWELVKTVAGSKTGVYVGDLENHIQKSFNREDLTRNGIYSVKDVLSYAEDMVAVKEEKVFPKMSNSSEPSHSVLGHEFTHDISVGVEDGLEDKDTDLDNYKSWESLPEDKLCYYPTKQRNGFCSEINKTTIERHDERLPVPEYDSNISDGMVRNFRKILEKYPKGIWITDLPQLYMDEFKVTLDCTELGYSSAIRLVSSLPHVFRYKRVGGNWKIYDARLEMETFQLEERKLEFSGTSDCNYVPQAILENVKLLADDYQDGFRSTELLSLYENHFNKSLDLKELNFRRLEDFLEILKEVVTVRKVTDYYLLLPKHTTLPLDVAWPVATDQVLNIPNNSISTLAPDNVMKPCQTIPIESLSSICNTLLKKDSLKVEIEVRLGEVISPSKFYIMLDSKYNELQIMMDDLDKFYKREQEHYQIPFASVTRNQFCACEYDGSWHRAKVIGFKPNNMIVIEYIDYGTPGLVKISDLRYLQNEFAKLPAQAIFAKLIGIKPLKEGSAEEWPTDVSKEFLNLVSDKRLFAEVYHINHTQGDQVQLEIILYDTEDPKEINFNEYFVAKGSAQFLNKDPADKVKSCRPPPGFESPNGPNGMSSFDNQSTDPASAFNTRSLCAVPPWEHYPLDTRFYNYNNAPQYTTFIPNDLFPNTANYPYLSNCYPVNLLSNQIYTSTPNHTQTLVQPHFEQSHNYLNNRSTNEAHQYETTKMPWNNTNFSTLPLPQQGLYNDPPLPSHQSTINFHMPDVQCPMPEQNVIKIDNKNVKTSHHSVHLPLPQQGLYNDLPLPSHQSTIDLHMSDVQCPMPEQNVTKIDNKNVKTSHHSVHLPLPQQGLYNDLPLPSHQSTINFHMSDVQCPMLEQNVIKIDNKNVKTSHHSVHLPLPQQGLYNDLPLPSHQSTINFHMSDVQCPMPEQNVIKIDNKNVKTSHHSVHLPLPQQGLYNDLPLPSHQSTINFHMSDVQCPMLEQNVIKIDNKNVKTSHHSVHLPLPQQGLYNDLPLPSHQSTINFHMPDVQCPMPEQNVIKIDNKNVKTSHHSVHLPLPQQGLYNDLPLPSHQSTINFHMSDVQCPMPEQNVIKIDNKNVKTSHHSVHLPLPQQGLYNDLPLPSHQSTIDLHMSDVQCPMLEQNVIKIDNKDVKTIHHSVPVIEQTADFDFNKPNTTKNKANISDVVVGTEISKPLKGKHISRQREECTSISEYDCGIKLLNALKSSSEEICADLENKSTEAVPDNSEDISSDGQIILLNNSNDECDTECKANMPCNNYSSETVPTIFENNLLLNNLDIPTEWKDGFNPDSNRTRSKEQTKNEICTRIDKVNMKKTLVQKLEIDYRSFHMILIKNKLAVCSQEFYGQLTTHHFHVIEKIVEVKYKPFQYIKKSDQPDLFSILDRIDFCNVAKKDVLKLDKVCISYLSDIPKVCCALNIKDQVLLDEIKAIETEYGED